MGFDGGGSGGRTRRALASRGRVGGRIWGGHGADLIAVTARGRGQAYGRSEGFGNVLESRWRGDDLSVACEVRRTGRI